MKLSVISLATVAAYAMADSNPPSCGDNQPACPEEYPCCSVDGTCGNGYVCLGGCDPRFSNQPGSCMPMPACKAGTTQFTSTDQVSTYADYLGDADKQPWSYLGNITVENNALRAQLFSHGPGTTISSSNYIWYGKVSIKLKTSHTQGVVSDFILLSSVKDEVDYEFVGNNLEQAQTNFYWHGALDYTKEVSEQVSDTYQNQHEYAIDWQPDHIDWIIDGNTVRTLKKSDTYNQTSQTYSFPQTPARVQFGLWPAGDSQFEGTSDWAGGKIDWNSPDITGDPGYFFAEIQEVTIDCYDPPSGADVQGSKAYVYTNKNGGEKDVRVTNDGTILGSTDGTGENPQGSKKNSSSSAQAHVTISGVQSSSTKNAQVISGASFASSKEAQTISGASFSTSTEASSSADASSAAASSAAESSSGNNNGGAAAGGSGQGSQEPTATEPSKQTAAASGGSSSSSSSSSAGKTNGAMALMVSTVALLMAPAALFL